MAKRTILLELDADDARDVIRAMSLREQFVCGVPDGGSSREGALLAEICRGWMEMLDAGQAARQRHDGKERP